MYTTPEVVMIEECPDLADGAVPTNGVETQLSAPIEYLNISALAVDPSVPPNITMVGVDCMVAIEPENEYLALGAFPGGVKANQAF
jgi:hypothetical protein